MNDKQIRQTELDVLKIIAFISVVCLHIAATVWNKVSVNSLDWQIINFFRGTWGVPVFIMISGNLLLNPYKKIDGKKIICYLCRIVIAFVIWSILYQIYHIIMGIVTVGVKEIDWKYYFISCFIGEYHMWYLIMLGGLYIITPFLRKIVENKSLTEYFIILFILFQFMYYYGTQIPKINYVLKPILEKGCFYFLLGYSGYYLIGYYLYKYSVSVKLEISIYIIGIVLLFLSTLGNIILSIYSNSPTEFFTKYDAPNVTIYSSAIYLFFIKRISRIPFKNKTRQRFAELSGISLGIYLVHVLFIDIIVENIGILPTTISPLIMIPLLTVLVVLLSIVTIKIISKIPLIGNYIT